MNLRVVLLDIIFHIIPSCLNWIQIQGAGKPLNNLYASSFDYRLCKSRGLALSFILLKLKLRILPQDLVHEGDNNTGIRALINFLLVLLPKKPLMPAVFPTN